MKNLIETLSDLNKQEETNFSHYQPLFYRLSKPEDKDKLDQLIQKTPHIKVFDKLLGQVEELVKSRTPKIVYTKQKLTDAAKAFLGNTPLYEYGVWVFYPWTNSLVHILDEKEFVEVRTNRNQYKITPEEEEILAQKKIGIIGLSVGQSIAVTMAMERIFGELRLADFDLLELSNLNRIRTGVHNMEVKKVILTAREIAEIDPFLKVTCYPDGLSEENINDFFLKDGKLDIVLDECDGLTMKIMCRQKAKELRVPVVMNSSDRGTTDVERFDLHPNLPLLHGLIDHLDLNKVREAKTNEEKVPYLLPMLGIDTTSKRLRASMLEIEETITTWPQLASSVVMGGGICTDVCRRIALGQFTDSGRYFIDVEEIICDKDYKDEDDVEKKLNIRNAITDEEMFQIIKHYKTEQFSTQEDLSNEVVKEIVEAATRAPSGANIQSWKWIYESKAIYLFLNDMYTAGLLDCKNSTSFTGLGAATENLVLKAHQLGYEVITEQLPLEENSKLVAVFKFFKTLTPEIKSQIEPHICDELVDTIPHRLTNRNIVKRQAIDKNKLLNYQKLAQSIPGMDMILIDDEKMIDEIKEVTAKVDRMRIMHFGGHDDLIAEVRWNKEEVEKTKNGVDILGTVDLTPTELAGWYVARNWNVINLLNKWKLGKGLEKIQRKNLASAGALGLITIPKFSQDNFFQAGRALERVWLAANKDNIAVHPASLSTLIFNHLNYADNNGFTEHMEQEARQLREEFTTLFGLQNDRVEMMLLRFFVAGPPKERSVRYPLEQVLSFGEKSIPSSANEILEKR